MLSGGILFALFGEVVFHADIPADTHNDSKINISLVYKMFV